MNGGWLHFRQVNSKGERVEVGIPDLVRATKRRVSALGSIGR